MRFIPPPQARRKHWTQHCNAQNDGDEPGLPDCFSHSHFSGSKSLCHPLRCDANSCIFLPPFAELTSALCPPTVAAMKFAKIHFADEKLAARALLGLAQRGRVVGLRDHTFIVPAPALEWLTESSLPYEL